MQQGYLAAVSASAYSFVSMVQRFGPIMNPGGAAISLTYLASEKIIPGAHFYMTAQPIAECFMWHHLDASSVWRRSTFELWILAPIVKHPRRTSRYDGTLESI